MRRTRLLPPYNEEGRTNFPARNRPGVYLIYKESRATPFGRSQNVLRYVGYSASDVYKALYRHFQIWNDRMAELGQRSERTVFKVRAGVKVRVIYCNTGHQAAELERALILLHKPTDNPDKLELYEITKAGQELASEATASPYVEDMEVPF